MMTRHGIAAAAATLVWAMPLCANAQQVIRLPAKDTPLTGQPTQLFALGSEDGEDWELFANVRSVAFDAKDNLYILDANNHRVLVFDANGRFVRKIGKKGEGPGELMSPVGMAVATDGNIVVADIGRRAFSIFKPDGTFVKNDLFPEGQMPGVGDIATGAAVQAHPRGGVVARTTPFRMVTPGSRPANGPTSFGERVTDFNWYALGTSKVTALASVKQTPLKAQTSEGGSGATRTFSMRIQRPNFEPPLVFGVLPSGGIAVAHNVGYRVEVMSGAGKAERVIERPSIVPRKVTDRDKRREMERQRESMKNGSGAGMQVRFGGGATSISTAGPGGDLPSVDKMLEDATFMDSIPALRRVDADPQGRIWIGRTASDLGTRGPIDIVSAADGRYIGTIANEWIPNAISKSGRAAYVQRDELGVEHVVVKRLPATWQ